VIKLFHLLFVFLWMGILFVMPRLICEGFSRCFKLYCRYELPAMVIGVVLGIFVLLTRPEKLASGFFHMKLTAVMGLIGCDLYIGRRAYLFERYNEPLSCRAAFLLQGLVIFFLLTVLCAILLGKKELGLYP